MKGIILAGGTGSRLWPVTRSVSKQLLPIYDKPMIFYPLATLIGAGIREVLIVTTPADSDAFRNLLGDGTDLGMRIDYAQQAQPRGLAEGLIIAEDFVGDDSVALVLGDNIFYGQGLGGQLKSLKEQDGATIFAYRVRDPQNYGVVEFDELGNAISLEEKPSSPRSNFAVPGLYFYDSNAISIAKSVTPSARGELEITAVNQKYLEMKKLSVHRLERGTAWLDTGTAANLNDAAHFVRVIQERQGLLVGCVHELAWRNQWISDADLQSIGQQMFASEYGQYLLSLLAMSTDQNRYERS